MADTTVDIKAENRILLIKARFRTNISEQNLFGQLLLIISGMDTLESYHTIISTYSDIYDEELHTNWDKYQEFIVERKWKGLFSINMTNSLNIYLDELKTDRSLYKILYTGAVTYNYSDLDIILYDLINRVLHEKTLILESVIQEITQDEYKKVQENRNKPTDVPKPDSKDTKKADDSVVLKVKPVLAPVKGKPIYSLKVGDTIMVKIVPDSPKQKEYIKIFKLEQDGILRSIPADIIDIKYGTDKNDPYEIIVKLDNKIFGRIIENEKQVKLRVYSPEIDGERSGIFSGSKTYTKTKSDRTIKLFVLLLSIFLTILAVVIVYTFMNL